MKKDLIIKVLFALSIILLIIFFVRIYLDYKVYDPLTYSAPFSAYIVINGLVFVIPSIIFLIVGIILKRKK